MEESDRKYCPDCGAELPPAAKFCDQCGAEQPDPQSGDSGEGTGEKSAQSPDDAVGGPTESPGRSTGDSAASPAHSTGGPSESAGQPSGGPADTPGQPAGEPTQTAGQPTRQAGNPANQRARQPGQAADQPPTNQPAGGQADDDGRSYLKLGLMAIGGIVVALFVLAFLAGFISGLMGAGVEQAEDPWSNEERTETATGERVDVDFDVEEGEFAVWTLQPQVSTEYDFTIETDDGKTVEVFLTDKENIENMRDNEEISYYTRFADTGDSMTISGTAPAGEYALVIDNSDFGDEDAEGDVSGHLTVEATV